MNLSEMSKQKVSDKVLLEENSGQLNSQTSPIHKSINDNEISIKNIKPNKVQNDDKIDTKNVAKHNDQKDIKNNAKPVKTKQTPSYSQKAVVLTYHHISNNPFSGITITPERFEEDLKMLKENNFNVISLRDMLNAMEGKFKLPQNAVVITFDDGIESFYRYAYPLLKKYNIPAVQFIITARNESYSPSDRELNPLSPEEISEMFSSGLVDIQSHTHNSHDYVYINSDFKKAPKLTFKIYNTDTNTKETDEEYLARITMDLQASREIIYKYTGVYPDMLCFPYGSYNKKVIDVARSQGYNYFITTEPGCNQENSKKSIIYRIRSGDAELSSNKLLEKIIECVKDEKKDK